MIYTSRLLSWWRESVLLKNGLVHRIIFLKIVSLFLGFLGKFLVKDHA